jgi:tripartite-type tricarboxylate transporter receptor subunit TctC
MITQRGPSLRGSRRTVALLFALLAFGAGVSNAQEYPTRPVRVIVPFSPGGAVDGPMRVVGQELSKRLGQQVVVENKPGAGATIGTEIVAHAAPDGYTLLLASQTNAISASLYKSLPFDPIEDFAPISLIGREPGVLVVHPSLPVKTLQEFVAYAKARPGKVDYASSGNGSGQHLFMAQLAAQTGMQLNHVPYRGSGQATTDVIAGVVPVSIPGTAGMVGHIKAGKLRALAVTGATRSPQLPDVPTVIESGVPGYEAYVWMGLLAPKGTPAPIVDRLNRELTQVLAGGEVKD